MGGFLGYLECPECGENATEYRQLFVAFSSYYIDGACQYCGTPIKTRRSFHACLMLGFLAGVIVNWVLSAPLFLRNIFTISLIVVFPKLFGQKLFEKDHRSFF